MDSSKEKDDSSGDTGGTTHRIAYMWIVRFLGHFSAHWRFSPSNIHHPHDILASYGSTGEDVFGNQCQECRTAYQYDCFPAREVLALPIWLYAMLGDEVTWRGNRYRILASGEAVRLASI